MKSRQSRINVDGRDIALIILTVAVVLLVANRCDSPPEAAALPLPETHADDDADNVRRVDFGGSDRKAKVA